MIQSDAKYFKCQVHKKKILSICLYQNCKQNRLVCHDCVKNNDHIQHLNDLIDFENLEAKIEETTTKNNNMIQQLNQMMNDVHNLYLNIKKGIDEKYNMPIQRINILTNEELIQYIDNMIKCDQYQETIRNQFKQNCKEFEQKLKKFLIELQLDTLTYNVTSEENKEIDEQLNNQDIESDQSLGSALYSDSDDYSGAIKLFDQASSYNREYMICLWGKGECVRMRGQYQDSISWFDKALSINPKHVESLNSKGDSLRQMGQYQDSITWYDKALLINPKHVDSLYGKGATLRLLKQLPEALEYQKRAYAIDPTHSWTLQEYGETLRELNQFNEAIKIFDKALSIDQNDDQVLAYKGDCLIQLEQYNEAQVCLIKAIEIDPNYQFAQNQLKICQEKLKALSQRQ